MKSSKILFLISITLIITLTFLTQSSKIEQEGIIKKVDYTTNKITIELENNSAKLVIFNKKIPFLKKGEEIHYIGKKEIYKNQEQIILEKIILR